MEGATFENYYTVQSGNESSCDFNLRMYIYIFFFTQEFLCYKSCIMVSGQIKTKILNYLYLQ